PTPVVLSLSKHPRVRRMPAAEARFPSITTLVILSFAEGSPGSEGCPRRGHLPVLHPDRCLFQAHPHGCGDPSTELGMTGSIKKETVPLSRRILTARGP